MTGPASPEDPLAGLAAEVGELSRRLAAVQARLLTLRGAGAAEASAGEAPSAAGPAGQPPGVPGPYGYPVPPTPGTYGPQGAYGQQGSYGPQGAHRPQGQYWPQGQYGPQGAYRPQGQYWPQGQYGSHGQVPQAPPQPILPVRPSREGLGPQLVAWTGGTVTLLGIVLLLVLAANRGWLQPGVRVVGGALLALALVGVAAWVHGRPGGRTGAVALAATGVAGLYLDVVAATALYEYLPVVGGLLVAVVVAGGGLALADRWRSEPLSAGAVAGAAVLAPVLTEAATPLLVLLAVILQAAAAPVVLRRRWTVLAVIAAVWPFLYGVLSVAWAADGGEHAQTTAAVAVVLLAGAALAVGGAERLPTVFCSVQLAVAAAPVLGMALVLDRAPGALTAVLVAALLFVVAAPIEQWPVPREVRAVAVVVGAVAAFEATMIALRGGTQTAVVLGEAIALAVAAIALRRRSVLLAAGGFGVVGTLLALDRDAPLQALLMFPSEPYVVLGEADTSALVTGVGVSALVLVAAVVMLVAAGRLGLLEPAERAPFWIAGAMVVLYGAAGLLVALALLVTTTRSGFLAGHVLTTVSWTVAALVLLVRGIRQPALRIAGGALVIAAVVKLVGFDLSQLDGLARVAAFLGAGLVLLAAGTRYARLVAAAQAAQPARAAQPAQPAQSTQAPPGHDQSGSAP